MAVLQVQTLHLELVQLIETEMLMDFGQLMKSPNFDSLYSAFLFFLAVLQVQMLSEARNLIDIENLIEAAGKLIDLGLLMKARQLL